MFSMKSCGTDAFGAKRNLGARRLLLVSLAAVSLSAILTVEKGHADCFVSQKKDGFIHGGFEAVHLPADARGVLYLNYGPG
jgi:hypothetical protein